MRSAQQYAFVVWDPRQQHLKSTLEMVQRRSARRILRDVSPTSSASAQVVQLQLENLQSGRTSNKVCMVYKIMNGLVDVEPAAGQLQPGTRSSREHRYQLQVPHSRTDTYAAFLLPIRLRNSRYQRCSISRDSTCLQVCPFLLYFTCVLSQSGA